MQIYFILFNYLYLLHHFCFTDLIFDQSKKINVINSWFLLVYFLFCFGFLFSNYFITFSFLVKLINNYIFIYIIIINIRFFILKKYHI